MIYQKSAQKILFLKYGCLVKDILSGDFVWIRTEMWVLPECNLGVWTMENMLLRHS